MLRLVRAGRSSSGTLLIRTVRSPSSSTPLTGGTNYSVNSAPSPTCSTSRRLTRLCRRKPRQRLRRGFSNGGVARRESVPIGIVVVISCYAAADVSSPLHLVCYPAKARLAVVPSGAGLEAGSATTDPAVLERAAEAVRSASRGQTVIVSRRDTSPVRWLHQASRARRPDCPIPG